MRPEIRFQWGRAVWPVPPGLHVQSDFLLRSCEILSSLCGCRTGQKARPHEDGGNSAGRAGRPAASPENRCTGERPLAPTVLPMPWILVITALAAILGGCSHPPARAVREPLVILGFDGADPDLPQRWTSEGKLPNIQRLAQSGTVQSLGTTDPPESPVAWASFATGLNPGKHGIFDFLEVDRARYLPDIGLVDVEKPRFLFVRCRSAAQGLPTIAREPLSTRPSPTRESRLRFSECRWRSPPRSCRPDAFCPASGCLTFGRPGGRSLTLRRT